MNIVLTGMMGTGKSVVGKRLSKKLSMKYIDTDEMIVQDVGRPINKIFEIDGETGFRKVERNAVKMISLLDNYVISCGGGVVLDSRNMDELEKNGLVICLIADPLVIYKRIKKTSQRPLLNVKDPIQAIEELIKRRKKYYSRCNLMIDTSDKKINEVVDEIIDYVNQY